MNAHLGDLLSRCEGNGFVLDGEPGAEFAPRVRRVAAGLVAAGFGIGDRLLIHTVKNSDQVAWLWAAALVGGVGVIAPPRIKDAQVRHLLADATPFAVVADPTRDLLLRAPADVWGQQRVWRSMAELIEGDGPATPAEGDPDRACVLLYSSGSTGMPKAIVQSHRTLVDGARIVASYLGLTARDRVLGVLALSFDYGLNQVLGAAWAGCAVVLRDYLGGADLAAAIVATRATVVAGVPTVWRDLAAELELGRPTADRTKEADRLSSLRVLTNTGGRWMPGDIAILRRAVPGAALHSMYGLTEAFRSAALDPAEIDDHPTSVGRAVPEVELLLVGVDGEVLAGPGEGELVHVGAFVGLGYWNRPDETARRFRLAPDGRAAVWSGDLVRRDEQGRLFFVARMDGQLKVDGFRVSPDEVVDAVLEQVTGVGAAAVVGVDDGARGHRLVLFVAAADGGALDGALVRGQCRAVLPSHLVPAEVRVLDDLPRTPHGKVDLVALRQAAT